MGLAGWFYEAGCMLYGSAVEASQARQVWSIADEEYGEIQAAWYAANELPDSVVAAVRSRANSYRRIVHSPPPAEAWTLLAPGQSVQLGGEEYQVLTGRGHAPDMLMLFRARDQVLLSADQILPGISPNVSCMPRLQDQNPLHSFLSTLNELKSLPEETLVLPSHGIPFRGLHARIDALRLHHEQRLHDVLHACREPVSAHDLFHLLFRRTLDAQQMSFALGESLAHLHYLEHEGEIVRQIDHGTARFVSPATV
jgi:glyoxylase-like metal-dependent hydrolase (beta-lactamase superfamily II)